MGKSTLIFGFFGIILLLTACATEYYPEEINARVIINGEEFVAENVITRQLGNSVYEKSIIYFYPDDAFVSVIMRSDSRSFEIYNGTIAYSLPFCRNKTGTPTALVEFNNDIAPNLDTKNSWNFQFSKNCKGDLIRYEIYISS